MRGLLRTCPACHQNQVRWQIPPGFEQSGLVTGRHLFRPNRECGYCRLQWVEGALVDDKDMRMPLLCRSATEAEIRKEIDRLLQLELIPPCEEGDYGIG